MFCNSFVVTGNFRILEHDESVVHLMFWNTQNCKDSYEFLFLSLTLMLNYLTWSQTSFSNYLQMLTGWDLAYLKVCFKVQGVRKELIAGDEMEVVKLSDLKLLFSKQTQFTVNCWPPGKSKSWLPKENVNGVIHAQQLASQNAVEANNSDKMTKSMSTKNGPNRIANSDNNNPGIYAVNNVRRDINVNINGVQVSRSAPEVNTYGTPATAAASANALGTSQSHATCSDATGSVIQNSFAEGLRGISANGKWAVF